MGNNKKPPAQASAENAHNDIMIRSKTVNNHPNGLLKSQPSQSSTSLFSRLSLSKLSPSHLMGGWPHKFLVNVQMLDDGKTVSEVFKKDSTGQDVFDYACKCLDIVEKEYFGLRYQDENNHRYWLDLSKPLSKQFRVNNLALSFRVRFYPENPACLREEVTRYQLFVQLQRDLLHGRLHLPQMNAASLAGLVLQSVLGDYDEELMGTGSDYVSEYKLLLKQSQRLEERIALAHQSYNGMTRPKLKQMKDIKQAQEITIGTTVHGVLYS
uniref:FERM domain-containing protein n=1 Tax=Ditylenchus dipsaci TaxID=166011 RepID=A0A915E3T9_9BILA